MPSAKKTHKIAYAPPVSGMKSLSGVPVSKLFFFLAKVGKNVESEC